jgi:hypothetical protein
VNLVFGLLLSALVATTTPASPAAKKDARPAERVPIFLQTDAHDPVGLEYIQQMRETLQESLYYRPVGDPESAKFVVGILTMDPNEAERAPNTLMPSTVASVTLRRENGKGPAEFVYSWVLVAKRDNVQSLATELLTAIDHEIQDFAAPKIQFVDEAASATK